MCDAKSVPLFMPSVYPAITADSDGRVGGEDGARSDQAAGHGIALQRGGASGPFDNTKLDGCATEGLDPPKTNWAR